MDKIIITGGNGRFASVLKKTFFNKKIFYLDKNKFNILKYKSMKNTIKDIKPKIIIHLAALSRPMILHINSLNKSIDANIIGTANLTKLCFEHKIKLIYFSTHYVYPGTKGNYKETDYLLPNNNYSWSKLGGECAVQMYLKNSLILRVAMYETPFMHKFGFNNLKTNFLTHKQVANILPKLINKSGIINLGGTKSTIFDFAKKTNKNVKPKFYRKNSLNLMPDTSVNNNKLKRILKEKFKILTTINTN
jgi:dTDP-4-dehydrorhamnose reductase